MTVSATARKKSSNTLGSVVRTVAPMVPLALALVHQAKTPTAPVTPAEPVSTASTGSAVTPHQAASGAPADAATLLKDCNSTQPCPLMSAGHPVEWFFVFKFNSASFPGCQGKDTCPFGGDPQTYPLGQHFAYASNESPALQDGGNACLGATTADPVSATFAQVYQKKFHYVMWNDQPYGDPQIPTCTSSGNCSAPWAHSKGMLAWNDQGEGLVMQVTTPNWPISGGATRATGNSLGCLRKSGTYSGDNVELSQDFFALVLSPSDVAKVLTGLVNAGVATDKSAGSMMISNGGPGNIQQLVSELGTEPSTSAKQLTDATLDSGVELLSKSSGMDLPPWQFVSAKLGGADMRVATFYDTDPIPSTQAGSLGTGACWDASLGTPGAVQNARTGTWQDPATGKAVSFGLGSTPTDGNHAKIGVTTDKTTAVFGDENQQGALTSTAVKAGCSAAQNGRGGTFYVVRDATLAGSVWNLLQGQSY